MKQQEKLKYLQIDTSKENLLFLKLVDNTKEDRILIKEKRCHLQKLVPSISEILKRNNLTLNDLDFIALNEGPGSWTGLRIGFSTTKILTQVNNINLILYSGFNILETKYQVKSGVFLIPINNNKYYSYVFSNNEPYSFSVVSESELVDFYPDFKRYYLDESELECDSYLVSLFNNKDFTDPKTAEPFYIAEGVIFDKS